MSRCVLYSSNEYSYVNISIPLYIIYNAGVVLHIHTFQHKAVHIVYIGCYYNIV